jgi:hypothetical protein
MTNNPGVNLLILIGAWWSLYHATIWLFVMLPRWASRRYRHKRTGIIGWLNSPSKPRTPRG